MNGLAIGVAAVSGPPGPSRTRFIEEEFTWAAASRTGEVIYDIFGGIPDGLDGILF